MVRLQHLLQQAQRSFLAFLGLLFAAVSLELHGELRVGFDVILTVTDGNVAAREPGVGGHSSPRHGIPVFGCYYSEPTKGTFATQVPSLPPRVPTRATPAPRRRAPPACVTPVSAQPAAPPASRLVAPTRIRTRKL